MTIATIVERVRAAIDELMENESGFLRESTDEANLTAVIKDKIGYALLYVLEHAPQDMLDADSFEVLTPEEVDAMFTPAADPATNMALLVLPDDLLRIVDARLSTWPYYPLPEPDTSQVALMQQDEYARGSWDRPVNILSRNASGKRVLKMYCGRTASDTLVFSFLRKPDTSGYAGGSDSTEVDVPERLEAALIYQIAGLTMLAFNDSHANALLEVARYALVNSE